MTRTLTDLSKSSVCSSIVSSVSRNSVVSVDVVSPEAATNESVDDEQRRNSYQQKEKLIEEIIGQLLIASQKFQKAIKDHESSVRSKQQQQQQHHRRLSVDDCRLPEGRRRNDHDCGGDDDTDDEPAGGSLLMYAKEAGFGVLPPVADKDASALDTSSESLSASLSVLIPTPPIVWLKQQERHLASPPHKKADSLPRTFQASVSAEEEWRANRPKTIASDKPTQMKGGGAGDANECGAFRSLRTKKPETSVSFASSLNASLTPTTAVATAATVHPECRFYRTSVTRMTLKRMMRSLSAKLLSRRGKGERFYRVVHEANRAPEKYARTDETERATTAGNCAGGLLGDGDMVDVAKHVVYRQGSADLGARIASGKEVPDYADPKVLFPTITPSKKAAALLGVRAYSNVSASRAIRDDRVDAIDQVGGENDAAEQSRFSADADQGARGPRTESHCSADSFYERQFEEAESEFENAIRETSILSDGGDAAAVDDALDADDVRESFRRYSQVSVNICVHKLIKIPPPVPAKTSAALADAAKERDISAPTARTSVATTSVARSKRKFVVASGESSIPTRGWVKQVVEKFQSTNDTD